MVVFWFAQKLWLLLGLCLVFGKRTLLFLLIFVLLKESLNHLCIVIVLLVLRNWEFLFVLSWLYYGVVVIILVVVISPWITYRGRERGHPCHSPLCICIGFEKKPLLVMVDVLSLHNIFMKSMKVCAMPGLVWITFNVFLLVVTFVGDTFSKLLVNYYVFVFFR